MGPDVTMNVVSITSRPNQHYQAKMERKRHTRRGSHNQSHTGQQDGLSMAKSRNE